MNGRIGVTAVLVAAAAGLAGCEPLSITAFGVGASAGISHTMGGYTYRTFTAPLPKVKSATLTALNRMGINGVKNGKEEGNELINATASG